MSVFRQWLATREPEPPEAVKVGLEVETIGATEAGELVGVLATAGRSRLDQARANLGRVRASAFHLLAADALVTYACEAALEADDPESALKAVVEVSVGP